MNTIIATEKAPKAIGPYSQAVAHEGFVFCSGQLGLDPASMTLKETVAEQTRQAMENLKAVLAAAKTDMAHVLKTTIFLKNMDDFAAVNEIYGAYFPENPPARATVEVARLPKNALVEIECIASFN